jgi:adenylate kinase family enzyme
LLGKKRILVLGCSGAGKSTLARQLGARLEIPVHHLDAMFWQPGWVLLPRAERIALLEHLVRANCWIIDGNYFSTLELLIEAADVIVLLDIAGWRCAWRVIKRRIVYRNATRADRADGCREQLDLEHVWRVLQYRRSELPQVLNYLADARSGTTIVTLRKPGEVSAFMKQLAAQK